MNNRDEILTASHLHVLLGEYLEYLNKDNPGVAEVIEMLIFKVLRHLKDDKLNFECKDRYISHYDEINNI